MTATFSAATSRSEPTGGENECSKDVVYFCSGMILLGIWLTGFDKAHWFLYIPVVFFALAGITGICPGLVFWNKVGFNNETLACDIRIRKS